MIATAELVVPKSIPMTGPLAFLSPPSELYRTNDDPYGVRRIFAGRVAVDVARGRALNSLEDSMVAVATRIEVLEEVED
jgi:hypothetical protein